MTTCVRLDLDEHHYLRDHSINGQVVVPFMVVADLMFKAAAARLPADINAQLHELVMLRGITLDQSADRGVSLRVTSSFGRPGRLDLNVLAESGHVCYQGSVGWSLDTARGDNAERQKKDCESRAESVVLEPARAFRDILFHGPSFQVLREIRRHDSRAIAGVIETGWAETWPIRPEYRPTADVPALDGGVQLAAIWASRRSGRDWLPTRVAHIDGLSGTGPVLCQVTPLTIDAWRFTADILYFDLASGHPRGAITGLEMYSYKRRITQ